MGIDGPSLMGRDWLAGSDWLAVFSLNRKEIYSIENCSIQSVLQRFTEIQGRTRYLERLWHKYETVLYAESR